MTPLPNQHWAVPVPQGAKNFVIIESHDYFKSPRIEHSIGGIDLPKDADYTIVSMADEISEQQAGEIVESTSFQMDTYWMDYESTEEGKFGFYTALESFSSLLRSKNLNPEQTLIIKKR